MVCDFNVLSFGNAAAGYSSEVYKMREMNSAMMVVVNAKEVSRHRADTR